MVAELMLCLSKDQSVQVRAFQDTDNDDKYFFCVKDFIRQTANKRMGPNDAMIYWLSTLGSLSHEDAIMDSRNILFLGPYEQENVCISAEGLILLYHHMDIRFQLVNEQYRSEVQDVLQEIHTNKASMETHVQMFDDGEIDEQLKECAETGEQPVDSKFYYKREAGDDTDVQLQLIAKIKELELIVKTQSAATQHEEKKHKKAALFEDQSWKNLGRKGVV